MENKKGTKKLIKSVKKSYSKLALAKKVKELEEEVKKLTAQNAKLEEDLKDLYAENEEYFQENYDLKNDNQALYNIVKYHETNGMPLARKYEEE